MIDFNFNSNCYSCGACVYHCPVDAISLDAELLPIVDITKCIHCEKCNKVCLSINDFDYTPHLVDGAKAYISKNLDIDERRNSSSGGVFIEIAEYVLNNGGYVCGCIYDSNFMPKHIISNRIEDIHKMMGSKYVKSDISKCFDSIRDCLMNGKIVLFTGTPCQVSAIKHAFGTFDKLILLAVICHGSIDRWIWHRYLGEKNSNGKRIISISMREKDRGWRDYGLKILFNDGTQFTTYRYSNGYFLNCFTKGLFDRDRCLNCKYKGTRIESDILLGDGWGVEKHYGEFSDELGVSYVVLLSQKGKDVFSSIEESQLHSIEIETKMVEDNNPRSISPPEEDDDRIEFQRALFSYSGEMEVFLKEYLKRKNPLGLRIIKRIKRIIHK